jgi:hypothetical protein
LGKCHYADLVTRQIPENTQHPTTLEIKCHRATQKWIKIDTCIRELDNTVQHLHTLTPFLHPSGNPSPTPGSHHQTSSSQNRTMSDDLDAFFSDVAAAEASVKPSDETFEEEDDNHRTKKRKLDNTPVIQTISSVSAKPMKAAETLVKKVEQQQPSYPAPPPPQPVYQQSYVHPSVAPYHQRQAPVPKPPPKPVAPKVEKQTNAAVRSAAGKTWIDHR